MGEQDWACRKQQDRGTPAALEDWDQGVKPAVQQGVSCQGPRNSFLRVAVKCDNMTSPERMPLTFQKRR